MTIRASHVKDLNNGREKESRRKAREISGYTRKSKSLRDIRKYIRG